jgi:hypothetical protein
MLSLGPIAFVTPWILLALLLLPLLWWLLRVTPPAPRQVRFPAIRLLFGLISREKTPDSSPLWLILLRLAMVAAFILAMAHPLINPGDELPGQGPVLLVVDDGWAAAPNWPARQAALRQTIAQAEREDRGTVLVTTAPSGAAEKPVITGVLKPSEARGAVDQLRPKPWPTDRKAAIPGIDGLKLGENKLVLWLSDGLDGPHAKPLAESLLRHGRVRVFTDTPDRLPKTLLPPDALESTLTATVRRSPGGAAETATVRAYAEDGRPLSRTEVAFEPGATEAVAQIDLPVELRNEVARIAIEQQNSAAAVALLDERWRRRPVGLISDRPLDTGPSLLNETYYIERALRPFSDLKHGGVADLLKSGRAVIIWPDEHAMAAADMAALTAWIEDGGLLLRFAGPRLARDIDDTLTPVRLRRGGRDLGGVLLWSQPARMTPFSEESPFRGLVIPPDVTISRQVLAEPSLDLAAKTWARLSDGTPLVTQERRGKGRLVLIHTTANTAWTNLPLSGLFIQLMRRILTTSRGVDADKIEKRPLPPLETLNGFGQATKPDAAATAIPAGAFANTKSSPRHPPGYYGFGDTRRALNLSPQIDSLAPLGDLPAGLQRQAYVNAEEVDLKPLLLVAALLLLLADIIASLALRGILRDALSVRGLRSSVSRGAAVGIVLCVGFVLMASAASAQSSGGRDARALEASLATRLAYVVTGDTAIDSVSKAGLTGLTDVLNQRTAVEVGAPIAVDVADDELAFYALLYWPISAEQSTPAPATIVKLNRYLQNGGTILFDTRDQTVSAAFISRPAQVLRQITRGLKLPPLEPVPPDHVLTKAFYLMQDFPGRWSGNQVWVERGNARSNDGVSRILVGSHDWAAAWAVDGGGRPMFAVVPGGERQREMAFRFGVNLVMYTLTGNYKSDQVHVPAILERLGQ